MKYKKNDIEKHNIIKNDIGIIEGNICWEYDENGNRTDWKAWTKCPGYYSISITNITHKVPPKEVIIHKGLVGKLNN